MPSSSRPGPHISGRVELLDAIPYLLGFRPSESLVLVGLHGGTLGVTARLDLADTGQPDLIEHSVAAMRRGGAHRFLVVVFDDRCRPPRPERPDEGWPWADAVVAVDDAVGSAGAELAEAMLVSRGRWWSYLCATSGCCPGQGRPLLAGPSPFAAAATYDGRVVLPTRDALADTLAPLPAPQRARLEPLITVAVQDAAAAEREQRLVLHRHGLVRDLVRGARCSAVAGWASPDDATVARLAAALSDIAVRDQVWMAVDAGRVDGRPLWAELGRRSPAPYDAAPMFLFGWASWRAGGGALAGMAAERALSSDPGYSAADLLLAALNQAVDPRTFPRLSDTGATATLRGRPRRAQRAAAARTPR